MKFYWNIFLESNWQYGSIDSHTGVVSNRQQAIIWTNIDTNASFGLND